MRGRRVFWTLPSLASVLLHGAIAQAQCTKDTDCKGDRVCEAGKCTSPVALPPAPPAPPGTDVAPNPEAAPVAAPPVTPSQPSEAPLRAVPPVAEERTPQPALDGPVPAGPLSRVAPDDPPRRSRAAMVGGIILVSTGPVALLAALVAKNAQDACDSRLDSDYPSHILPTSERYRVDECNGYSVPIFVLGIGGAVLTAAGLPLVIYGAKRVPNAPQASLRVLPWANREAGGLRLRFEL